LPYDLQKAKWLCFMEKKRIFISSVQKEFAKERQLLCNYIRQDALLGKYFVPFIFEELPAANQSAQQSYLSEVQNSDIYLGMAGTNYGFELPLESIREAIVNAVAHRDYTSKGSIQVMLFRNRLEIWNPGHLPTGITIEQLYEVHESFPNNPLIANPLYLAGYAERLGTGTADILKQCLAIGLKPPTFSQTDNFRITFWRNLETLNENAETLKPNLESSSIDFENITKKSVETLRANLETLKPLQGLPKRMTREELEKVILILCSKEYLTVNQISILIGKSSAYLLNEIIPSLITEQKLVRLYPATPNHQNQAYKTKQAL